MPASVASWPLTGAPSIPAASSALAAEFARPSFAAKTASTSLFGVGEDLLHERLCFGVVPAGHVLVGDDLPLAGLGLRLDPLRVARAEEEGVVVLLPAVEQDNALRIRVESVDCGIHDLGHGRADRDVVEAHVRVAAGAAGVEAVVLDHLDAGILRLVDDRGAGAGVDADEEDDARVVGDRLLGLRLLLGRVVLGVDDVGLDPCRLEGLFEVAPVVGLPARRAGAVGEEHPDALVTGAFASAVAGGRSGVATGVVIVVSAAPGRDHREGRDQRDQDDEPQPAQRRFAGLVRKSAHDFLLVD